ncbi:MAG: glycosyltransferase family protein [Planctomycetota bacterium]
MRTIFYGVMGEGRGHAARARAMTERLRGEARVALFTSNDALAFLRTAYAGDAEVEVRDIPGLKFHYRGDQLNNVKTVTEGLRFWAALGRNARAMDDAFRSEKPDLVVTDFEPLVARAARRHGVPVVSLDHQHFLSTYDLTSLPKRLQRWAWLMSWSIWAFDLRQQRTIVSAFYKPPLRAACDGVTQVGPLLRPAVAERTAHRGGHVLSYLRRATPPRVVDLLTESPLPVKVYGLGDRPPRGAVTFHPIDEDTFLDDLAGCDCVVAAAGNQLLGEALHFGKPVLALPEEHHHEQNINACFLEQMGAGERRTLERFAGADLAGFLERREAYRTNLAESDEHFDGVEAAASAVMDAIERL